MYPLVFRSGFSEYIAGFYAVMIVDLYALFYAIFVLFRVSLSVIFVSSVADPGGKFSHDSPMSPSILSVDFGPLQRREKIIIPSLIFSNINL